MESNTTARAMLRDEAMMVPNSTNAATTASTSSIEPTAEPTADTSSEQDQGSIEKPKRGFQFWAIIVALCIVGLLAALENTVVTTSLPTIVHDLNVGANYIWITNVFFLTR